MMTLQNYCDLLPTVNLHTRLSALSFQNPPDSHQDKCQNIDDFSNNGLTHVPCAVALSDFGENFFWLPRKWSWRNV